MKTKMLLLIVMLGWIPASLMAQKNKEGKFSFGSQNYAGILEGEAGNSFQLQTINGLKYKTWFAGVGAGLDYYYERTIPLFFSVSKFLPSRKTPFYFNGDIGVNIPWAERRYYSVSGDDSFSPALYWGGGLGYKFAFKQSRHGILLNFGYSYKHVIQESTYTNPCLIGPCPTEKERYDYRLRRISVKLGWMF